MIFSYRFNEANTHKMLTTRYKLVETAEIANEDVIEESEYERIENICCRIIIDVVNIVYLNAVSQCIGLKPFTFRSSNVPNINEVVMTSASPTVDTMRCASLDFENCDMDLKTSRNKSYVVCNVRI